MGALVHAKPVYHYEMGCAMRCLGTLIWVVALLVLPACGNETAPGNENGFLFYDPSLQQKFVEALKSDGVRFRQQRDGTVLYDAADDIKVTRIRDSVIKQSFVPSYNFSDGKLEARFIDQLKANGIPFGIDSKNGKRWVTWTERDDSRARKLLDNVLDSAVKHNT